MIFFKNDSKYSLNSENLKPDFSLVIHTWKTDWKILAQSEDDQSLQQVNPVCDAVRVDYSPCKGETPQRKD